MDLDKSHHVIRGIINKKKPTIEDIRHVIPLMVALLFFAEKCVGRKKRELHYHHCYFSYETISCCGS